MRTLLDVNVLIALLDADHTSHHAAISWFRTHAGNGWASCPITQNDCPRIMSHPGYPNAHHDHAIADRLREATAQQVHEFWAADVSLLDADVIDPTRIHGPRQLTDVFLLALAVRHGGFLLTFDHSVGIDAVKGATKRHLVVL